VKIHSDNGGIHTSNCEIHTPCVFQIFYQSTLIDTAIYKSFQRFSHKYTDHSKWQRWYLLTYGKTIMLMILNDLRGPL